MNMKEMKDLEFMHKIMAKLTDDEYDFLTDRITNSILKENIDIQTTQSIIADIFGFNLKGQSLGLISKYSTLDIVSTDGDSPRTNKYEKKGMNSAQNHMSVIVEMAA